MAVAEPQNTQRKFSFISSLAADIWRPKSDRKAYEWWYFDALSDDGRDCVVVIFYDNFVFSPRYNRETAPIADHQVVNENQAGYRLPEFTIPAIEFFYCRDGKPLYHAINEFEIGDFSAGEKLPSCRIGENFFRFEAAPYGAGYFLSVKARLKNKRHLEATFEWLSIEGDLLKSPGANAAEGHVWNLAVARADVSGRVRVTDEQDKEIDLIHFRGTGYHDHNFDSRWIAETIEDWQWGRAHFSDATAVFYRYKECAENESSTKLLVIRDGRLEETEAACEEQDFARNFYGLRYPQQIAFSDDERSLSVKQTKILDSNLFYLRFLAEMTLTLPGEKPRQAIGITEFLNPKILRFRWLDWFANRRIERK